MNNDHKKQIPPIGVKETVTMIGGLLAIFVMGGFIAISAGDYVASHTHTALGNAVTAGYSLLTGAVMLAWWNK